MVKFNLISALFLKKTDLQQVKNSPPEEQIRAIKKMSKRCADPGRRDKQFASSALQEQIDAARYIFVKTASKGEQGEFSVGGKLIQALTKLFAAFGDSAVPELNNIAEANRKSHLFRVITAPLIDALAMIDSPMAHDTLLKLAGAEKDISLGYVYLRAIKDLDDARVQPILERFANNSDRILSDRARDALMNRAAGKAKARECLECGTELSSDRSGGIETALAVATTGNRKLADNFPYRCERCNSILCKSCSEKINCPRCGGNSYSRWL